MAKVSSPLHSIEAQGTIGENLTFSVRKSGQQVRFQRKQKDIITAKRSSQRADYSTAVEAWKNLTSAEKNYFTNLAYSRHMTGYNFYVKLGIGQLYTAIYGERIYGILNFGLNL